VNILFISHCDFPGNSAIQIFSIAAHLAELGINCAVCVPEGHTVVTGNRDLKFSILSYSQVQLNSFRFHDGRGPDFIHVWTPRKRVMRLAQSLVAAGRTKYIVQLEDNEDVLLETELGLSASGVRPSDELIDKDVPDHLSHPRRSRQFLAGASGITVIIDRLLEFKPPAVPGIVLWPGFDSEFLVGTDLGQFSGRQVGVSNEDSVLVYNGNIHAANASEVRSLFLAVQALRRSGRPIVLLKTGEQFVSPDDWIQEGIQSGAVVDLGRRSRQDIYGLLSIADLLVQPGRPGHFNDYRFPSKLPEFFASGKPVVLPRSNVGLRVCDGQEALLLNSGDAIEIAQKIELLLDNPEMGRRIGAAGREFAIQHLSWSKNVPLLKDFYDSLQ
jgi:glycosyltransferase involved in cell wall biosynthesis